MSVTVQNVSHKELISRMLKVYNDVQSRPYSITQWPDEEERTTRACDAYAEALGACPLAIEHTRIETFASRKLDDARLLKIFAPLEAELKGAFPFRVELWIPTFALQPGTDWNRVKSSIKAWLLENSTRFEDAAGPRLEVPRRTYDVPGVPFPLNVVKRSNRPANFVVGRIAPHGLDVSFELTERFTAALADKNEQLAQYQRVGVETILLAESDDISLVSLPILYRAFLIAWDRASPQNIQQVWMAYVPSSEHLEIVCFLGPEELMEKVNPPNYLYGPQHRDMWLSAMREEGFAGLS